MTFEDLVALLENCADREKEKMFSFELYEVTRDFIESVISTSKKYGKDANASLAIALGAASDTARVFDFNKLKGGEDK